jgi:hypothetical protein
MKWKGKCFVGLLDRGDWLVLKKLIRFFEVKNSNDLGTVFEDTLLSGTSQNATIEPIIMFQINFLTDAWILEIFCGNLS